MDGVSAFPRFSVVDGFAAETVQRASVFADAAEDSAPNASNTRPASCILARRRRDTSRVTSPAVTSKAIPSCHSLPSECTSHPKPRISKTGLEENAYASAPETSFAVSRSASVAESARASARQLFESNAGVADPGSR